MTCSVKLAIVRAVLLALMDQIDKSKITLVNVKINTFRILRKTVKIATTNAPRAISLRRIAQVASISLR